MTELIGFLIFMTLAGINFGNALYNKDCNKDWMKIGALSTGFMCLGNALWILFR
jgi:hypothetical protein